MSQHPRCAYITDGLKQMNKLFINNIITVMHTLSTDYRRVNTILSIPINSIHPQKSHSEKGKVILHRVGRIKLPEGVGEFYGG